MAEDIRVAAFLHAKPGEEEAVLKAALACVAPTRAEAGNAAYFLNRDSADPSLFVFIEHWHSRAALDEHMQTPHLQALAAALEGKLTKAPAIHILNPV
jgi:quinol monooxygenase YgiN